jgi:hypothetical protein
LNTQMQPFTNITKLLSQRQIPPKSSLINVFNTDKKYDLLRKDIDTCCEVAIRYKLVVDEGKGLLKGGRTIYQDSTLYELRIARLFEHYFGKGCLIWDPPGRGNKLGDFQLNIENASRKKTSIFTEVKAIEVQGLTEHGTFESKENSIVNSLKNAHKKIPDDIEIPVLCVLCHDHFNIEISDFEIIKSCYGSIYFDEARSEGLSSYGGFFSPDINTKFSAIGLYYHYSNYHSPVSFEIYHNENANIQINNEIFKNKADKQFRLSVWSGKFS